MKLAFMAQLGMALPRAELIMSALGAEVYDVKGDCIGYVQSDNECFYIKADYEYLELTKQALKDCAVNYKVREFEPLYRKHRE